MKGWWLYYSSVPIRFVGLVINFIESPPVVQSGEFCEAAAETYQRMNKRKPNTIKFQFLNSHLTQECIQ